MESAVISFTFDDFPRSALLNAGAILRERGVAGTYYASFGIMGRKTTTAELFTRDDLGELVQQGTKWRVIPSTTGLFQLVLNRDAPYAFSS